VTNTISADANANSEIWYADGDHLRFVLRKHTADGSPQRILQMLWYTDGMAKREWRDVPVVDENEQ
jgi:hypothetical protein